MHKFGKPSQPAIGAFSFEVSWTQVSRALYLTYGILRQQHVTSPQPQGLDEKMFRFDVAVAQVPGTVDGPLGEVTQQGRHTKPQQQQPEPQLLQRLF